MIEVVSALVVPETLDGAAYALMGVSFVASFITAAFGIGGGALLLAAMATLMPAAALIPVHGVVQLASNLTRAGLLFSHVAWTALPAFAVGSLIGVALGGAIVVELRPEFVQIGIGVFVIYSVLARAPAWIGRWPWATGLMSSFLTMFFGATGLFVAGYTKSLKLPRQGHVASHAALMTVQHGLKVVVFGVLGFAFAPWAGFIAAMIVCGAVGTVLGRRVLVRLSEDGFRRALDALLVLLALRLIWGGVSGWAG